MWNNIEHPAQIGSSDTLKQLIEAILSLIETRHSRGSSCFSCKWSATARARGGKVSRMPRSSPNMAPKLNSSHTAPERRLYDLFSPLGVDCFELSKAII